MRLSVLLLAACAGPSPTAPGDDDDDTAMSAPIADMAGYLAACEAELGPWPGIDCRDAVEVPITVTDAGGTRTVTSLADLEDGRCDRSSIGGCAPGTRVDAFTTETGATFAYGCRTYDDDPAYDQVNVVWTMPGDGATCFLSTKHADQRYGDGSDVPRPGSDEDVAWDDEGRPFWYTFPDLQGSACLDCHENDPILRNPWIEQVGVLPVGDPLGPFHLVANEELLQGDALWQPSRKLADPDLAPCLECHRLGERRTCTLALEATGRVPRGLTTTFFATTWPYDHWMPEIGHDELLALYPTEADWDAEFGAAADALERCCADDAPDSCFTP